MEVYLSSKADKQLSKTPRKMHELLIKKIELLAKNPYGPNAKKLTNREGYRLRVGDYRILFTVEKKKLIILSVAHRKDAYRVKP